MNNKTHKIAFLAIFSLVLMAQAIVCAGQIRVGGYKEIDPQDKYVVGAANFAVKAQSKKGDAIELVSILAAERQTVQGANYKLCLEVTADGEEDSSQAVAVVYLNLKNVYSLTSWAAETCAEEEDETVTYKGTLEMGRSRSAIVYFGEESGDLAAFCFPNNSEVGRAILKACRKGDQCEFTGKIDSEAACKINDQRDLSASGQIISVESVRRIAAKR